MNHPSPHTLFNMISFQALVLLFPVSMLVLWRFPALWVRMLVLYLGLLTGLLDLRTDDAQFPVLLLLVFGFFAGFAQPRRAWLSALLLGMWVPVVTIAALFAGVIRGRPYGVPAAGLAFLPALLGAYLGVWLQRASARTVGGGSR